MEVDLVVHCGSSTLGEYINTVSTTKLSSGWGEDEAIMEESQEYSFRALKEAPSNTSEGLFPLAKVVVDPFHVTTDANKRVDEARRIEQDIYRKREGEDA